MPENRPFNAVLANYFVQFTVFQEQRDADRNITGFALHQKMGGSNPGRLKQVWDEYLAGQAVTKAEPVAELP